MRNIQPSLQLILAGVLVWVASSCGQTARQGAQVTVTTEPVDGAVVRIGESVIGQTPLTFEPTRTGTLLFSVEKEGYKTARELVEVPQAGEVHLHVPLEQRLGYVTLTSVPDGAAVFLDGEELVGRTPLRDFRVPVGRRVFTLRKQNYREATQEVTVEEDYRYSFSHALNAEPSRLAIYSRPTGARIWLDNIAQDRTTPAVFELPPGTYSIALSAQGYLPYEQVVTLEPADQASIEAALLQGEAPPGMVLVPAGEFIFGLDGSSPDQQPQQTVYLDAFYIDRTEVTNEQFKAVFPNHRFPENHEHFPVTGVNYRQAEAYAAAIGKRLPTEKEWEKAARGTDGRLYPWGNTWAATKANSGAVHGAVLRRVGMFREGVSPYGCLDMAGNAYEWTSSWYQAYPGNTRIRAEYGQIYKVLRGGSYRVDRLDVRTTSRHFDRLDATRGDYGFRCAMNVIDIEHP